MSMKINERALLKLMLEALKESRECLDIAQAELVKEGWPEVPRITKSLDHSNRVMRRAMISLQECDLL